MIETAIVIAKRPVAGRVKTRLVPPLDHEQAAHLAAAALTDTLRAIENLPVFRRILAFDGPSDEWLPPGWLHRDQVDGGLDRRLVGAFLEAGSGPAVLVGMDTPQLNPQQITCFDAENYDACLGLAPDGGYWAIGFRDPGRAAEIINGIAMSTEHTGRLQLQRMLGLGLRVQLLDELVDVDTMADAYAVAEAAPGTAFAAAVRDLDGVA